MNGYQFEVMVPSTIFDGLAGTVDAYRGKNLVNFVGFKFENMPRWDAPSQEILITKEDKCTLEQAVNLLLLKLPEVEE